MVCGSYSVSQLGAVRNRPNPLGRVFSPLDLPVCCEEDPPQPPLKRGENQLLVPLFKGDARGISGFEDTP